MKRIARSALVEHSAERMYALVEHIEAYPQFLPWCREARVLERGPGRTVATLSVGLKGMRYSFTTENDNRFPVEISLRLLRLCRALRVVDVVLLALRGGAQNPSTALQRGEGLARPAAVLCLGLLVLRGRRRLLVGLLLLFHAFLESLFLFLEARGGGARGRRVAGGRGGRSRRIQRTRGHAGRGWLVAVANGAVLVHPAVQLLRRPGHGKQGERQAHQKRSSHSRVPRSGCGAPQCGAITRV